MSRAYLCDLSVLKFNSLNLVRLDLRDAAIYKQLNAVYKTGIARSQEESHCCNLFRPPNLAARNLRLEELLCVRPQGVQDRRIDRSRAQYIHPYFPFFQLQ